MHRTTRPSHEVVFELQEKIDRCKERWNKYGKNHLMFIKGLQELIDNCMSFDLDMHGVLCTCRWYTQRNIDPVRGYTDWIKEGYIIVQRALFDEYTREFGPQVEGREDPVFVFDMRNVNVKFDKDAVRVYWEKDQEKYLAVFQWIRVNPILFNEDQE